jgi:phage terminase large subunit GpA-like protein
VTLLADPLVLAKGVIEIAMRPPPKQDLNDWAEANIVFGRESPFPGPYRRTTIPPAARILEVLSPDHPARTVTIKASAQFFKTTIGQIFVGGSMDIDPCDIGYTHPSHDNALRWARRKWKVMRKQSPALKRVFGEAKSRDAGDTMLYQEHRLGLGSLQISGANSAASLSMVSWPKQVQDDLSKWESNIAGDPERQADGRSSAFDWAKILKISTPLFRKTCRITRNYIAGTQERFHVPCLHCKHYQPLEWDNFQGNIDPAKPDDVHFTCIECGAAIEHKHKVAIIARGRWVADNPSAREPSFHIWRAYSPFRDWASIAREWLASQGDPHAEQTFYNDVLGLEFEQAAEAPAWEEIRERSNAPDGYQRGRIPPGALLICVGVDCQKDRTEIHIKGFGEGLRRWTIDYRIVTHHIGDAGAHAALDGILQETWPDAFGNRRSIDMLAIDGNAFTNEVFAWAKRHPQQKVIVVRGAKSDLAPPIALTKTERKVDGKVRNRQKRFYNVGVSQLKAALYKLLRQADPLARGFCGYPQGLDDEFYRQLTAERRVIEKDRWGYPRAFWRLDHDRNEVLDTEMYAEAAAVRCSFYSRSPEDWARMRASREMQSQRGQRDLFDPASEHHSATERLDDPAVASNEAHIAPPAAPSAPAGPRRFRRVSSRSGYMD